ncbi:CHAT domain-containing protein [Streptomyces sp. NPDC051105]|uniref:CHAT domain-containing protein n=1 Tax=Streptomyces sp. NPDC051105 TaxID=3154843 RepID=UPI0034149CE4
MPRRGRLVQRAPGRSSRPGQRTGGRRPPRPQCAETPRRRPTVAEVGGLDIDAHLAYLSACSTAQGTSRLMGEALRLATAFQLAELRHVVGTLWPVSDEAAYAFADHAYTALAEHPFEVAQSVHTAARRLRASFRAPLLWASHIHLGPANDGSVEVSQVPS